MTPRRRNPKRTLYHGTLRQFKAVDIVDGLGIHVGSLAAARARLGDVQGKGMVAVERRAVISLAVDLKRTLRTWDCGHWFNPYWAIPAIADGLRDAADSNDTVLAAFQMKRHADNYLNNISMRLRDMAYAFGANASPQRMVAKLALIRAGLIRLGYDSISYKNKFEAKGSMSYIIIDKKAILGERVDEVTP